MKKLLILLLIIFTVKIAVAQMHVNGVGYGTYTKNVRIPASQLGKNVTHPPAINNYGITNVYEFTVNTDAAYYKFGVPGDYASGDIAINILWTRSTTGNDESAKTVKWQVKNLVVDLSGENCNSGEVTDAVQDSYDSASTTDQIVYFTSSITIAAEEFNDMEIIIMEISAVTVDSGVALSEPALVSMGFTYTANRVHP